MHGFTDNMIAILEVNRRALANGLTYGDQEAKEHDLRNADKRRMKRLKKLWEGVNNGK